MGQGRKKIPTRIKELRGTTRPDRTLDNEMTVEVVSNIPEPPEWLSVIGAEEWIKFALRYTTKGCYAILT